MAVAQVFEKASADVVDRRAALAAAGALTLGDSLPRDFEPIAVPEPLSTLLPDGIRRGETIALPGDHAPAPSPSAPAAIPTPARDLDGSPTRRTPSKFDSTVDYLTLALLAGALRQGLWCAAVGARGLGGAALAGLLGDEALQDGALQRLLVVDGPGERWAEIAAVLADGVDLILLRPPAAVPTQIARRVDARLRQGATDESRHRAALLVLGAWPAARTTLRVRHLGWTGFNAGVGHLTAGRAQIDAEDRTRRTRSVQLLLPEDLGADVALSTLIRPAQNRKEAATPRLTAVA
ncbi:MAG TPA: hypothetical protein VL551_20750 [Actinospica sp.]|nr:hypothetical protein [Actinospica sp.]